MQKAPTFKIITTDGEASLSDLAVALLPYLTSQGKIVTKTQMNAMEKRVNVLQERIRSGDKARKLAESMLHKSQAELADSIAKLESLQL